MLGILAGDTMTTGPGRAFKDGSLGCIGCGAVLTSGPGVAHKDGSLGGPRLTGLGSPMAVGPGRAHQDGALGLINSTADLVAGLVVGGAAAWLILRKKKKG
jgi:hypothetical protein